MFYSQLKSKESHFSVSTRVIGESTTQQKAEPLVLIIRCPALDVYELHTVHAFQVHCSCRAIVRALLTVLVLPLNQHVSEVYVYHVISPFLSNENNLNCFLVNINELDHSKTSNCKSPPYAPSSISPQTPALLA